jgi:hypothetical protein
MSDEMFAVAVVGLVALVALALGRKLRFKWGRWTWWIGSNTKK